MADNTAYRFPQARIQIEGTEDSLNIPPDYLVGLKHEMMSVGAGNKVTIELFDPSWGILDLFLQKARATTGGLLKLRYQYGFYDEPSQIYLSGVAKSNPGNLSLLGAELTLEAVDEGVLEAFTRRPTPGVGDNRTYRMNIGTIVTQLCASHGWTPDVEQPEPTYESTGRNGNVERTWVKGRMTDLEFIRYLAQFARSNSVPGRYQVRLETNGEGVTTLHFRPPPNRQLYDIYTVAHSRLGRVISFEPELNNLSTSVLGGTGLEVIGRSVETRARHQETTDSTRDTNSTYLGSRTVMPPGAVARQITEATSQSQMRNAMAAYYSSLAEMVQKGSLTIVGDPYIRPNDLIGILVMTPQGQRYYTSGTWRVNKVVNEVKAGSFTTTLEVNRNATDVGNLAPRGPVVNLQNIVDTVRQQAEAIRKQLKKQFSWLFG